MSPREVEGPEIFPLSCAEFKAKRPQKNLKRLGNPTPTPVTVYNNLTMAPTTRQAATSQDTVQDGPSEQRQTDHELIAQLRAQIDALTAMIPTPEDLVVRTIERDTPAATTVMG